METAIAIVIAVAIIYQGSKLIIEQRKLKKKMKSMENDMINRSIDYSGDVGSGISLTRKNYPTMEDDFREKSYKLEPTTSELRDNIDRKSRHNVNPANRPSLIQEKYGKENDEIN